ncbi:2',3'-cyclic-nucleotide 2'-phosphodiesterase (5'-nucleotidase family) [Weissella uvarum]|uniref:bifunctional metallophosphatase/5'-nucleotidase n=1 Tax=Weissella uvarum TaxID=1479233 RepID=UPI001961E158|nr:bifunctional UDP-sugar hydrolase/5'-nucleotidase [Weissella uvarum]MBM7616524.1 2',3'-cyclic-nucleotide 2'-phosphodiesterase (5'-nucleotidase family) [Weissella uvarum]MCM0595015.1 bifunctional metallophosphatase/5'-nucleotidase [Weissella uvarum]
MQENLLILHTNDLHSHLENWPKVKRYIKTQQQHAQRQAVQNFVFDIGDAIDRQHPLTEATAGQANIQLMNDIGYSAATVGNNEVLGLNHAQMDQLYDEANFPIVLANVLDAKTHQLPKWAQAYRILTTKGGQKLAVLGLTAPFERTLPLVDWEPEPVDETLERLLPELKQQADTIILLSHLGLPTDRQIAEKFNDIDLILGAHTHHVLPEGEWHGKTLLAAAGRYGSHVGKVRLSIENGKMVQAQATVQATDELPSLPEDQAQIDQWYQRGTKKLRQEQLANLPVTYSTDLQQQHRLIDLGLDSLKDYWSTDLALLSSGMFLADLPAGPVNKNDLHEILPHAVHPMRTTLVGHELARLVFEIKKNQGFLLNYQIKGMGFRGNHQAFGKMVWSGLELDADGNIWVDSQPLDPYRQYAIATLDHYLFIPFFPTIEIAGTNQMDYDVVLREVVAHYLQKKF